MYVKVRVMAGVKKEAIERVSKDAFKLSVREPAERNMANTRVRELIAREFSISVAKVKIISGHHSPSKILSVNTD